MDSLKISFKTKSVHGKVKGVCFSEGEHFIFYIPSLNLSSYGNTLQEATDMMREAVLPDFCNSVTAKKPAFVFKELEDLGWSRRSLFREELSRASQIDRAGILRDFDLSPETEFNEMDIAV